MAHVTSRYPALSAFLQPWSPLWGRSVFDRFDEAARLIPESWFEFGACSALSAQFEAAQGRGASEVPADLRSWVALARELCEFELECEPVPLRREFDRELTPKKRHEIESLLGFLRSRLKSGSKVLDIGGGVGHLARHLALELGCSVVSVDRDAVLQRDGQAVLSQWPWRDEGLSVRFVRGEFPEVSVAGCGWTIGLHTCGALAWRHLQHHVEYPVEARGSVLNVGCCYEKLNAASETQRSELARKHPLAWTQEALFLANRGGVERTAEGFEFQQRVMRYRFTLQELLRHEGLSEIDSVGAAPDQAYRGDFANYVRSRSVARELVLSDAAMEDFFRTSAPRVERMRFASLLRNILARPLEVAIVLDRAAYLQERGVEARVVRLFDPAISPRNLGVVGREKLRRTSW